MIKLLHGFEEVIGKAPNVNFSTGGSQANIYKYVVLVKESQFQYPLNPSVGLNVDGMDFK